MNRELCQVPLGMVRGINSADAVELSRLNVCVSQFIDALYLLRLEEYIW